MKTLRGAPESSTASAYGIFAAKAALESCAATMLPTGADGACAGRDPSMSIAAACNKTTTWQGPQRKPAFQLCMKTRRGTPGSGRIVAAKAALESCEATERTASKLSKDPKLPEIQQATYGGCVDLYGLARSGITAMSDALKTCSLPGQLRGLEDADTAVNECVRVLRLIDGGVSSPLHRMVLADRDRIMLASLLGALIPDTK